jgi:hypothetical protein
LTKGERKPWRRGKVYAESMPALLLHLTAVERLAAHVNTLPPDFSRALGEDLEYARFGAALPELPWFGGWTMGLDAWLGLGEAPRYSRLLTDKAPVGFGLKAAELVSNGALVGSEPGLAFLAGYFTQLCVSRSLEPLMQTVLRSSTAMSRSRVEWSWSLSLMQELHGSTLVGTPSIRSKLQIRKGSPLKGVGRGLYELMRVSSNEALGEAPSKHAVDAWMRGLAWFSLTLGSPLGRLRALQSAQGSMKELFRGPGVDVFAAVDRGLDHTREVLVLVGSMIRRNAFSARNRLKFLKLLPEGAVDQVTRAA